MVFEGHELMKPGYSRFNLPFFSTPEEVEYVIKAIEFVAQFGWMLMPQYRFDPATGAVVHRNAAID
jgi:hypothetical protein